MPERFVQTTEVHSLYGKQTVSDAAQLVGHLPNGWKLKELKYDEEAGAWVAIVQGEREQMKD